MGLTFKLVLFAKGMFCSHFRLKLFFFFISTDCILYQETLVIVD